MNQQYLYQRAREIVAEREAEAQLWRFAHARNDGRDEADVSQAPFALRAGAKLAANISRGAAHLARTLDPAIRVETREFEH